WLETPCCRICDWCCGLRYIPAINTIPMRRPPRFARIVADHRALLMAVERLDCGIDIENPRLGEQRPDAIIQMRLQPMHARGLLDLRQRPPQRIFADHFAHPQQRRGDPTPPAT